MFTIKQILFSTGALVALSASLFSAPPQAATSPADNTAVNKQAGKTAGDQKETAQDRKITQQIRKALTSDKSLSTYARNVKIITIDGVVTLRGPVRSDEEVKTIEARAKEVTGVTSVTNEMTVAAKTSSEPDKLKTN